jgi:hypothetical protein
MQVSEDGLWVVTEPGVGVRQPGWHGSRPGSGGGGGGPDGDDVSDTDDADDPLEDLDIDADDGEDVDADSDDDSEEDLDSDDSEEDDDEEPCEPGDWTPSVSASVKSDGPVKDRINRAINRIPGVNVTLEEVKGEVAGARRDCCDADDNKVTNGEGWAEGTFTLTARLKDITIWGPPAIRKKFDWGLGEAIVVFNVGVKLEADVNLGMTGGRRWNLCGGETCFYSKVAAELAVTAKATNEAAVTVCFLWCDENGDPDFSINITPAAITVKIEAFAQYNSKEKCDGFSGG